MSVDRLASFEPTHVDELAVLLRFALAHMQAPNGSAVWLRLSTRALLQAPRVLDEAAVIAGGHWVVPPARGASIALAYQGPVAEEATVAFESLREDVQVRDSWLSRVRIASMPAGLRHSGHAVPAPQRQATSRRSWHPSPQVPH